MLDIIEEQGIKNIDSSAVYGKCEQYLGELNASDRFTIDTKLPGVAGPEPSTKDVVIATGEKSLGKLNTTQVSFVLWKPETPFSNTSYHLTILF